MADPTVIPLSSNKGEIKLKRCSTDVHPQRQQTRV